MAVTLLPTNFLIAHIIFVLPSYYVLEGKEGTITPSAEFIVQTIYKK
jgi:hypothetical protein